MSTELSEVDLRVLAVLIEKSLATPGGYPLTLSAIVAGANQRQNREPVTGYTEADASKALSKLVHRGLAVQAAPAPGARVVRFEHRVVEGFHWDRREQAIMAELILRGRQTLGELRTRASRMTPLADLDSARATVQTLIEADPPFVEELPREPGRSTNRLRHLLGSNRSEKGPQPVPSPAHRGDAGPTGGQDTGRTLAHRVETLERQVADLTGVVARLQEKIALGGDEPDRISV